MDESWEEYVQHDLAEFETAKTLKGIPFVEAVSKLACTSYKSTFFRAFNKNITLERNGDKLYIRHAGVLRTWEINDVLANDWVEK
jgi:hypothetical protein